MDKNLRLAKPLLVKTKLFGIFLGTSILKLSLFKGFFGCSLGHRWRDPHPQKAVENETNHLKGTPEILLTIEHFLLKEKSSELFFLGNFQKSRNLPTPISSAHSRPAWQKQQKCFKKKASSALLIEKKIQEKRGKNHRFCPKSLGKSWFSCFFLEFFLCR